MSTLEPGVTLEDRITLLALRVSKLELSAASKKKSGPASVLKKVGASLLAAFTTPEAVKAEKSMAVIVGTRLALLLPGAAVLIDLLVKALGGPSVTP